MDDVSLTFDNSMFLSGLNKITESMGHMFNDFDKGADEMSDQWHSFAKEFVESESKVSIFQNSIGKLFQKIPLLGKAVQFVKDSFSNMFQKAGDGIEKLADNHNKATKKIEGNNKSMTLSFIKASAVIGLVKSAYSKLMQNIPEIGRAFQIAGDIMLRNFLFPLRQQLVPYLQKVLNWVRDHRAMFVRLGGVLVNVFQLFKTVVTSAVNVLKPFFEMAAKFFQNIFGKAASSISELANMLIFKLAAVFIFLEAVLRPIAEAISKLIFQVLELGRSFGTGFMEGIKSMKIFDVELSGLIDSFKELLGIIGLTDGEMAGLSEAFKNIGYVIGVVVGGAIKLVINSLKMLVDTAIFAGKVLHKAFGESKESWGDIFKGYGSKMKNNVMTGVEVYKNGYTNIKSGPQIEPKGATKNNVLNANNSMKIEKIEVHVKDEEEGKRIGTTFGTNVGNSMHQTFRRQVNQANFVKGM